MSPLLQGRFRLFVCGLLTTLVAIFLLLYPPELLRFFDYRIYDLLLFSQRSRELDFRPVVVGIDEQSLARFGQWPWPRYRLAQLIDALRRQKVAAIGIDLLMPEEDRTSPEVIQRERLRDLGEVYSAGHVGLNGKSNDALLADAISLAPAVLGFKFLRASEIATDRQPVPEPLTGIVVSNESLLASSRSGADGLLASIDMLAQAAKKTAFTNAAPDRDGVVRRLPLVLPYRGQYYPSLALATVQVASGHEALRLDVVEQEAFLNWNERRIPLDSRGNMLIGFAREPLYRSVSAADLLLGKLPADSLAGSLVFVGAVSAGLGDRHVTPINRNFPGVNIHAVVAENILNRQWFSHPVWVRGVEIVVVALGGILSAWLLSCCNLLIPLVALFAAGCGMTWGTVVLFQMERCFISPTVPVLILLVNAALLGLLRYGIAANHLRHRNRDLLKAQDATIVSLTILAETRDTDTGAHILRTQRFVKALAGQLQKGSLYSDDILDEDVEMLFMSAPLHDIGKVGIPDRILLKAGALAEEETEIMRGHTLIGASALGRTAEVLGQPEKYSYLHYARQMAETHHERWDGSGYPAGLKGTQIPLAGRLMALADVYDAMISVRCYKEAVPHERTRDYIVAMSGSLFDPEIVAAFLECEDVFADIAREYQDELLPEF